MGNEPSRQGDRGANSQQNNTGQGQRGSYGSIQQHARSNNTQQESGSSSTFQQRLASLTSGSFTQEMQAKTREVAQKLMLTKAKSDNTEEQKRQAATGAVRQHNQQQSHKRQSSIQGIQIENDPLEREIYVICPGCQQRVFDSGLENELECDACSLVFVSGKEYTSEQIRSMQEESLQRLEDKDDYYDEEEDEDDSSDDSSPSEDPSSEEKKQTHHIRLKMEESSLQDPGDSRSSKNDEEEGEEEEAKQTSKKLQIHSPVKKLTAGGSPAVMKNPSTPNSGKSHHQQFGVQNQSDSSSKYVNELEEVVLFCNVDTVMEDFIDPSTKQAKLSLIQQQLLLPFFQLRTRILERTSYFKIGDIEFYVAACEPYDFGKVSQRTTLRCTQSVSKSDVLQRVNLVPLKRLDNSRTAIFETAIKPFLEANPDFHVHKNQILEFEDYEFYVKYARPFFGKVDLASTDIKIDSSTPKPVQVLRIAPIWQTDEQYERASSRKRETFEYIKQTYLNPFFFCGFMCYVERGETIKIDDQEFFLNDCRPKYGIVDKQTIIELEVGFTQEVFKKKQVLADQRFAEKIQTRDTQPAGIGPGSGAAAGGQLTAQAIRHRMAMLGMPEMMQNPQIRQSRDEIAAYLQRITQQIVQQQNRGERANSNLSEYHLMLMLQAQGGLHGNPAGVSTSVTPKAIVEALPLREITEDYLQKQQMIAMANDDSNDESRKCMICIMDYEPGEQVRTMPCLHFFHKDCIDKWLLTRSNTCPVCKFDIRKNYNLSAPIEFEEPQLDRQSRSSQY